MSLSPLKIILNLILIAALGLIGFILVGFGFFSYKEKTLVTGCEREYCVDQTKSQVLALFDGEYSFENGVIVPHASMTRPNKPIFIEQTNSVEELNERDRWTIVYNEVNGWQKFVHLKFKNEVLYQIDIRNYGPFYIDP